MAATTTLTLPGASTAAPTNEGSIFFIGNATVLLRVAGFTILTDPTFIHKHEQTWLGGGLHTTRLTDPAMELADLPPLDLVLPDVMGSVLDVTMADGGASRIFITGDTLVIDELREIPQRFPDIDIALLHLGGTRVLGILVSMDAKQGVEAMRIVDPALAIPIHYNDYDVFTSSLSDFQEEVRAAGFEDRVHYLRHGETYTF